MKNAMLIAPRGFEDKLPALQSKYEVIYNATRSIAHKYGFDAYEGPMLESLELYLQKSSEELVREQTFVLTDRGDRTLVLRPEKTPSLARMIAANVQSLSFPARLYNIGPSFRYEAPQMGRRRQFCQLDFDIIGDDSSTADSEIISLFCELLQTLGLERSDFAMHISSREVMQTALSDIHIDTKMHPTIFGIIDRMDKTSPEKIELQLHQTLQSTTQTTQLLQLIHEKSSFLKYCDTLLSNLQGTPSEKFVVIDPLIVRGLLYYTGVVFEAKGTGPLKRSLLGGGRYDNLIAQFDPKLKIGGVGGASSDVVLLDYLESIGKPIKATSSSPKVLICTLTSATNQVQLLAKTSKVCRAQNIATLTLVNDQKIEKKIKYALAKDCTHLIIIGQSEVESEILNCKNLSNRESRSLTIAQLEHYFKP